MTAALLLQQPESLKTAVKKSCDADAPANTHRLGLRAISPLLHGHRPHANRNKKQAVKSISDTAGAVWALVNMTQASIRAGIFLNDT